MHPGRVPSHLFLSPLADIVEGDADLMRVFEPLLRHMDEAGEPLFGGDDSVFSEKATATMHRLQPHLHSLPGHVQPFGVIIDETQKITEAVEHHKLPYFKEGWYGWRNSPGNLFVRMDIASSHGA